MPIDESQRERAQRLIALWLETEWAGLAATPDAALLCAISAWPKGEVLMPLAHATSISLPIRQLIEIAGHKPRLLGEIDRLKLNADDCSGCSGALWVCGPELAGMSLPLWAFEVRQAGLPLVILAPDPDAAPGLADMPTTMIATKLAGAGLFAGSRDWIDQAKNWHKITQLHETALDRLCAELERRISHADVMGQIDDCEAAPGPFATTTYKGHADGTMTLFREDD